VIFANFAEAMAEGRVRPRRTPFERCARKPRRGDFVRRDRELVPAASLQKGDLVVCEANDLIPSDGEIVEGIASVDESAITVNRLQ